jgi:hypothetical protein
VEETVKWALQEFGPIAIGWLVAGYLGYRVLTDASHARRESTADKITNKDVLDDFHDLVAAYHIAVVDCAKTMERLAVLIEERTRDRTRH